MRVKSHHVAVSLFVGAIALGSFAWLNLQVPSALATCSTGFAISIGQPPPNTTLSGTANLIASVTGPTAPSSVTFTLTAPTQSVLGDASPVGTTGNQWSFPWNTTTVPDGGYQLVAISHYGSNTAYDCPSNPIPVNVTNSAGGGSQQPTLNAVISPNPWAGPPGAHQQFSVTGVYTNQVGTQYPVSSASGATFNWGTTTGSLNSTTAQTVILTAGAALGNFNVGVQVSMNGLHTPVVATIHVVAAGSPHTASSPPPSGTPPPTATPPAPTSAPTPNLTPTQVQQLETTPTIFRPQKPTNSDPIVPVEVLGCVQSILGADYTGVSNGVTAPTIADRLKADACFSGSNKIPAVLAPVSPSQITTLATESQIVAVSSIKNETIQNNSTKVKAILLSGTGTPSSSIFLYVFSNDPMVLRAQTDSQGHWTYVLDNPLNPGQHNVYAVSQSASNNFVRTSALPFAVAAAASGSNDGSLVIQNKFSSAQIAYVAGAVLLVIIGIFLLFRIRRRAHPPAVTTAGSSAGSVVLPAAPPSVNTQAQAPPVTPPSPTDPAQDSGHDHPA